ETVVSVCPRRNIYSHTIIRIQLAVGSDIGDRLLDELGMGGAAKKRRRAWINPGFCGISTRQRERTDAEPLCAQIGLYRTLGKTVLVNRVDDLQPLPMIDIGHGVVGTVGNPLEDSGQRRVGIDVSTC